MAPSGAEEDQTNQIGRDAEKKSAKNSGHYPTTAGLLRLPMPGI